MSVHSFHLCDNGIMWAFLTFNGWFASRTTEGMLEFSSFYPLIAIQDVRVTSGAILVSRYAVLIGTVHCILS